MIFLGLASIARPDKGFGFLLAAVFMALPCYEIERRQRPR